MSYPERYEKLPPLDAHEAALTVRTVGWLLLVHDALFVALFAPGSIKEDSRVWPVWMVAEGLAGLTLVVAGNLMEERAAATAKSAAPERERTRKVA